MFTWSLRKYLQLVILTSVTSMLAAIMGLLDIVGIIQAVSEHLVTLSVTLVVFPLLAVPLMLQVTKTAIEFVGEKPTKGLYRDFNTACLLVSLGALIETILLLLTLLYQESGYVEIIISSLAFGNFISFIIIFILVIMLLQKIVIELEAVFTE